jgi:hypothetical protein
MASDDSASIRGDVRNQAESLFMVISLVTGLRAVLFPTASHVGRLVQVRPKLLDTSTPSFDTTRAWRIEE